MICFLGFNLFIIYICAIIKVIYLVIIFLYLKDHYYYYYLSVIIELEDLNQFNLLNQLS